MYAAFLSQWRATFEYEPIYHSFRAITDFPDTEIRQGLARCDLTGPLFIGTIIEALSNKGYEDIQEMTIVVLPELYSRLFTSDKALKGSGNRGVVGAAAKEYHDVTGKPRRSHPAAAQVFFAIVN